MEYSDKFEETLETLNEIQRQAVLSDADSLQILAGPGSGKTRVLTVRIAYLVVKKHIDPQNIIVVTFTKKATNEMTERLNVLIGKKRTSQLILGTFHSVCSRLLRRFGGYAGMKRDFVIIDYKECVTIMSDVKKDLEARLKAENKGLQSYVKGYNADVIYKMLSKSKNKGVTAEDYAAKAETVFEKEVAMLYTGYEEELLKNNLIDFDNLLLKACRVLEVKKDAWDHVEAVLVDEYQDTNTVQYRLIELIAAQENKRTLTIVGDPDQSIFGWRSAEPANFGKMCHDFKGTVAINMEQNYRSSGTVLKSALHVIVQDKHRIDKSLYTNNADGVPISFITTSNEMDQAEFVAREIKRVIKYSKGLITHKDIAILMRMNYISQKFEHSFRKHKIPYTVAKGDRFFGRIEIQDILGYLRLAYNPNDASSFKRIINTPKRGVGDVNLRKIIDYREKNKIDFLVALEQIAKQKKGRNFSAGLCRALANLYEICMEIRAQLDEETNLSKIIGNIIEATNYKKYLQDTYTKKEDFESRWANLGELVTLAEQFSHEQEEYEDIDSSIYVDSQEPSQQKPPEKEWDEDDMVEVNEVSDEDEEFFPASQNFDSTQEFDSQNVVFTQTQTQYSEPEQILNEAFQDDFNEEDEPVYTTKKSTLQNFLEYCSLSSDEKELEAAEGGKVTIATMHASKGLEWPCVFVVTCNESIIPMKNAENIDEEGRLLYVAMTRSKFLLYCVSPRKLDTFGYTNKRDRSRFLDGMDKKLYVTKVPGWNNSVRRVLAKTIGKPAPPDDDSLCTDDNEYDTHDGEEIDTMDIRFGGGNSVDLSTMGGFTTALTLSNKRPTDVFKISKKQKRIKVEEE